MREPNEPTEKFQTGVPFTVGSVTLLSVERVVTLEGGGDRLAWFSMTKEPYALVVRDASGIRVIDASAIAVTLDQLREKTPDLDAVLASI
jgi:hypothetical protein